MLRDRRTLLFFAIVAVTAIWIRWWASLGFPLSHEICGEAKAPYDCESYNILFYSAWAFGKTVDHWSSLVTAVATGIIGLFTYTLYKATSGMVEVARIQSEDMKESIVAAKIAANASKKAAETAEMSLLASNQPLLIVEDLLLVGDDINPPRIKFTVANDGNGTAVILSIGGHIQIVEVAGRSEQVSMRDSWHNSIGTSIAKGSKFGPLVITNKSLNAKRYNGIIDGGTKIFLDLKIGAQDIFKNPYPQQFAFTFDFYEGNFVRDDSIKPKKNGET